MKSIRNIAYASLLALSSLTCLSALASAEDARGSFTLTHDVRWQNVTVPAGDYKFSIELRGPSEMLMLSKMSGDRLGYIILVNDAETVAPYAVKETAVSGKLTVVSDAGARYVSTMELPSLGMTLHFAVPTETRELASAGGASASSAK